MINIKITKKKFIILITTLIYRFFLDLSYIIYVNPRFEYEGFVNNLNFVKLLESYFLMIITTLAIPIVNKKPSNIVLNILNFIMIIPIFSIFSFKDESRIYTYGVFISFIISLVSIRLLPRINVKVKLSINKTIYLFLFFLSLCVHAILIYYNGLPNLELFNFNNVYKVRGTVNYGFKFMIYLVSWLGIVINPFLIIINFRKKNKFMFFILVFNQVILYLLTSHKSLLFYLLILPALIYFIKKDKIIGYIPIGMGLVVILSLCIYFFDKKSLVPLLSIYRTLFLPAQISFQYYEFFSENGFVLLSHSIFERFFSSPIYDIHPIRIIGQIYYRNNYPNTGYLGDAYMNFGISGMIVFSILLSVILSIIDALSHDDDKVIISGAFMGILSIQLCNTGLLTTLLTGGLLAYMLLLLLYNDYGNSL